MIVHIGDSHVQAGFITQPVRTGLQEKFGNGGRGIIFPYRLAKSNGPPGYISASPLQWQFSRNAAPHRILPTGISGFTLRSAQPGASFTIEFTATDILGKSPSHLTIYHAGRDSCSRFSVYDDISGKVYPVIDSSRAFATVFKLDDQPGRLRITTNYIQDSLRQATFYGMSIEGSQPGVVVHMIGVNGATFDNYLHAEHFSEQLAQLHPDLLIISLGTNEAAGSIYFNPEVFTASVDSLMATIRKAGIDAGVVFTTPPGIYKATRKKRRTSYKPNPAAETVSNLLISYAKKHDCASWNWFDVMGGPTAMAKWKSKHMTDKRYIHFSSKGYGIEGMLLYEALMESYNRSKVTH